STFQLITRMSLLFFARKKSGPKCKEKTFFTACHEIRSTNNEMTPRAGFTNNQNKIKSKRRTIRYGKRSVNKLKNHQYSGSKYFTLAPAIKKSAIMIFNVTNTFFVNLRRKGFSIYPIRLMIKAVGK